FAGDDTDGAFAVFGLNVEGDVIRRHLTVWIQDIRKHLFLSRGFNSDQVSSEAKAIVAQTMTGDAAFLVNGLTFLGIASQAQRILKLFDNLLSRRRARCAEHLER